MDRLYTLICLLSLSTVYYVFRRYNRISIKDIRGPKSESFLLGHSPDLAISDCGTTESKLQAEFGGVARIKASFGEDRLFLSDPKALQHILQTSGYTYHKLRGMLVTSELLMDRGLVWSEGDVHKRFRRAMLPAFGTPETRAFVPLFRKAIGKVVTKWTDFILADESGKSKVLDIPFWLSKATLDAIGAAAFDYDFGSVEDVENPLTKSYNNLMVTAFGSPSRKKLFWENISADLPMALLRILYEFSPGSGVKMLIKNRTEVHKVSQELLKGKNDTLAQGKWNKDVMSLLIKANASENEKTRLKDEEITPQMRTILLAGHETTANSVTWVLYELSRRPDVQNRMRAEIREMQATIHARGEEDFTASDFDAMPYTIAVMKETLRLYPVAFRMVREASKDDIIPLFKPIVTESGKVLNEIPVAKGTKVWLSIIGYNTNKDVWGEDAFEFKPDRWLVAKEKTSPALGVYGNLLTFSGGIRSCIGWRFAVIEMQSFLVSLLLNFEFSVPAGAKEIKRLRAGVMTPVVEGEHGAQMPLKVSLLSK